MKAKRSFVVSLLYLLVISKLYANNKVFFNKLNNRGYSFQGLFPDPPPSI